MELTAKVIRILPLQTGVSTKTGNKWHLLTFVVETQESYPRQVAIELFGEQRINDNPVQLEQLVTVSFDLESREVGGRYYTSARAWKVVAGQPQAAQAVQKPQVAQPFVPTEEQYASEAAPYDPARPQQATPTFDQVAGQGETDLPF